MARIEEVRDANRRERERKERHHRRAFDTFGPDLGAAYFRYVEGEEVQVGETGVNPLDAFAEAVISATESGTHDDKVAALKAVLYAFEFKLKDVLKETHRASGSVRY